MDNYRYILQANRETLADIINMLVNDGHHVIPDELWDSTHVIDHGGNHEEVMEWLSLNTLDNTRQNAYYHISKEHKPQ